MDQEDQGDHNPPWWTRGGFYLLLMTTDVCTIDFSSIGRPTEDARVKDMCSGDHSISYV